jgi:hypothetical protein
MHRDSVPSASNCSTMPDCPRASDGSVPDTAPEASVLDGPGSRSGRAAGLLRSSRRLQLGPGQGRLVVVLSVPPARQIVAGIWGLGGQHRESFCGLGWPLIRLSCLYYTAGLRTVQPERRFGLRYYRFPCSRRKSAAAYSAHCAWVSDVTRITSKNALSDMDMCPSLWIPKLRIDETGENRYLVDDDGNHLALGSPVLMY